MTAQVDNIGDDPTLFAMERPAVSLADRFTFPPFSILDRRQGEWQDRKRRWLELGIQSEVGRSEGLTIASTSQWMIDAIDASGGTTSIFDPVIAEVAYRWFSAPGDRILDPFAGGSVRGIVASVLQRWYVGIELRGEQVDANIDQLHIATGPDPVWIEGDSSHADDLLGDDEFDLVFTCPPYADLERYSDDPRDLSTMPYPEFLAGYGACLAAAWRHLRRDRFYAVVVSDVRDKAGHYRGLVGHTTDIVQRLGGHLYNDIVVLDPVGTGAIRAPRYFGSNRKVIRQHQHLLVYVKGDARKAAAHSKENE